MPFPGKRCAVVLAATVAVAAADQAGAEASDEHTVRRSYGPDRVATAAAVSADHREQATDAVLTTSVTFPDALSAGALSGRLGAPLLLTEPDRLRGVVTDELERLGVQTVWVLGGSHAVSAPVESDLGERGYDVRRVGGANRYATARDAALAAGPSEGREVVVALGDHPRPHRAWADAVAAGALAAVPDPLPTLLTAADQLPPESEQALVELGTERVLLLGGHAAIAPEVGRRLEQLGYAVDRVAGSSRYETSAALAAKAMERSDNGAPTAVFASGANFPDALSAGALAAELEGPLLLVPPDALADSTEEFLREHAERWDGGVMVGGPVAASDRVLEELADALGGDGEVVVETFEGEASWYGPGFEGRPTASGEPFDPNQLTAAHRTLDFDTRVRVTNPDNGAQVVVRINDRGPFHGNRVIDVSAAAADALGFRSQGVAWVINEVLAD